MEPIRFLMVWRIIFGLILILNPLVLWAGIIWSPDSWFAGFCVIGLDVWGGAGLIAMAWLFGTRAGRRQFGSLWRQKFRPEHSSASKQTSDGNGGAR